ncbi:uncharacterized protein [Cicer arietinum]|uniref:uncharacterized protein n=1 Tax=Cicer arietinum TaxID=3827 RepID=UPI003CC52C56
MKAYMKKHDIVSQRIFRAKVREVVFPHTTSILAPPEKVRTNGASKKKKEFDTPRDPSYWEYVDASQESAKQPSQRSARQSSQSSQYSAKQPFYTHFPTLIHPYIEEIIDVVADGNCGFRAIAALLGWTEESWPLVRTQLDKEIRLHQDLYANVFDDSVESVRNSLNISGLGAQGQDKWMCLPDLGFHHPTHQHHLNHQHQDVQKYQEYHQRSAPSVAAEGHPPPYVHARWSQHHRPGPPVVFDDAA